MKPKHFILTLLTLIFSITASAYEWTDANGTVWSFDTSGSNATLYKESNTPCISGTIPSDLTIPSTVYISETAYTVTSIGNGAFFACSSLTSIDLPEGVTSIGARAFSNCSSLTSIDLPDGVTSIGVYAFSMCSSLTSIDLPDGINTIEGYIFDNCSSLTSIEIPSGVTSVYATAFNNCPKLFSLYFTSTTPKVTYTGWGNSPTLFVPNEAVDAYRTAWPNYITKILPIDSANRVYEAEVEASENSSAVVEEIGEENALNVVNLKVTGSINSYDVMVFRNKMLNLRNLDLSDATIVGNPYKYYNNQYYTKDNIITGYFGTSSLFSVTLPNNITSIDASAFNGCANLTTITIPEGVDFIGSSAFYGCSQLQSVFLPNGLTEISGWTFSGCESLATVNIPSGITSIGAYAFSHCGSLSTINLPKKLKTIEAHAFDYCGFAQIKIPPYIETFGDYAFYGCGKLNDITIYIPDYTLSVNENAFSTYTTATLKIPRFLYNDYYYNEGGWKRFTNIVRCDLEPGDYESLPTNSDTSISDNDEIIPHTSEDAPINGEIFDEGSITVTDGVTGTQEFDEVEQNIDGEGQGGSVIGEDDGEHEGNLTVKTLRVKINVKAGRWYFFCFPYDVTIASCEYPGQYAWRYYDGAYRASNGSGGWKPVTGETLTANVGYAFQTSHTGNLIISFNNPTFGGDRSKTLVAHAAANAANASWNLVGNTYSSFYEFNENDISSPITVWNGNSYTAYRPGDDDFHLQPYEAFFVQKPSGTSSINFEAERRETYRQSEVKKAARVKAFRTKGINPQRRLINLEIMSDEEQVDRTRVVLNQKASHAYEMECDAAKFLSTDADAQLYSVENGTQMAINERPQEGDIRLGYVAKKAGTLSISASRMDMPMVLVDTKLGTTFDLSLGTYDFDTAAGTFNNRFLLRPSGDATAINALTAQTGVCIGTQDGGIAIGGAEGKTIYVYAANGTLTAQHTGNGFIALKRGAYVVNVDGAGATVSVK